MFKGTFSVASFHAIYHFEFIGIEARQVTIRIFGGKLEIEDGFVGKPNITITADGKEWLSFLAKEKSIASLLIRRKLRLKGSPKLLVAFGKYFV
ncbi:hypothetical protein CU633_17240 [Bacillus sp. V3-13]|uniref:SCP2 sterol-binding domain-containing protein n=1 Tax=Bacillus sp. V3-13 TaxID=2053728 RepID=UPI000C7634AE|nr:SCP2 sterol-binding domain-containing protein [Bacillus sp. V3-13]PLR76155.1 hypothetical protein CU633_17240 [Bacillus sp. V3-13]